MTEREQAEKVAEEILTALEAVNIHLGYPFTQPLMNVREAFTQALLRFGAEQRQAGRERDIVDDYRAWARTHNRENYGRYDAFVAGYRLAFEEQPSQAGEREEKPDGA